MQGKQFRQLEAELWRAVDQLRANSKLMATQYFMPILGLTFLRQANNCLLHVKNELDQALPVHSQRGSRPVNGVIAQYEKHSASNIVKYGVEETIGEQKITIPKEGARIAFTEKLKPTFTLIRTLDEQTTKLREPRDILLPKLMGGKKV